MALVEDGGPLRIQANGQQNSQRFLPPQPQLLWVLLDSDSMEIYQRIYELSARIGFVLLIDPSLQCAQIVSQMGNSCRLDA